MFLFWFFFFFPSFPHGTVLIRLHVVQLVLVRVLLSFLEHPEVHAPPALCYYVLNEGHAVRIKKGHAHKQQQWRSLHAHQENESYKRYKCLDTY